MLLLYALSPQKSTVIHYPGRLLVATEWYYFPKWNIKGFQDKCPGRFKLIDNCSLYTYHVYDSHDIPKIVEKIVGDKNIQGCYSQQKKAILICRTFIPTTLHFYLKMSGKVVIS